ncbi:aldo/keto reductase [Amylibacter sp.]|nr:aldo/keto reductase [Amylibacter sp.]
MLQESQIKKLTLGTAQFGLNYGITNVSGKMTSSEIQQVIDTAYSLGITKIDTAPGYGDAEFELGSIGVKDFALFSKLPRIKDGDTREDLLKIIKSSIDRMKIEQLEGLLLHYPWDLLSEKVTVLRDVLEEASRLGLYKRLGISLYEPHEIHQFMDIVSFDFIQAPVNIFDQRFCDPNLLKFLREKNIKLHARSVYLQGLLLDRKNFKSRKINKQLKKYLKEWFTWLDKHALSEVEAAISFVLRLNEVENIVFGISCAKDLEELLSSSIVDMDFPDFGVNPIYTDPRKW